MKYIIKNNGNDVEKYGVKVGHVCELVEEDKSCNGFLLYNSNWNMTVWLHEDQIEIFGIVPNRDFLRDFVKMNKIKTTRVSKALGKSQNWLTQMMNDKRRDMTDETLKNIMKQLHIDWASSEFLNVKSEVPYRTRPSNYKTTQHKERLQRDFWNGLVTK